jgi:hypothetical protein
MRANEIFPIPQAISHTRCQGRRDAKRLVDAYEIVKRGVQREGTEMVLKLFGEGIGQPREAAHPHAHRKVRPLDVRRADVFALRMTRNAGVAASDALGRAIAPDRSLGAGTVDFDEHPV